MSAAAPGRRSADNSNSLFVGRHSELAVIAQVVSQAHAGEPRLLLVEGPAGIGKTAMIRQFLSDVPSGDRADPGSDVAAGCVLWASGEQDEAGLSYGVLDQLVAAATDALAAASTTTTTTTTTAPNTATATDQHLDPFAAGAAFVDLLGALQRTGPVVVVVDDVHWADRPSLQSLTFALRRLRVDRVATVVTVRDLVEARMPDGLRRLLADERTARIRLDGLLAGDLQALSAKFRRGLPAGHQLSARAAQRLRAHTGGNPLHARALLEQVPAEVLDNLANPLPVPRSFAMLMLARLASCSQEGRELVLAASVLGNHCTLFRAAAVAGADEPLPALDQAVAAGLLEERPNDGGLQFPHPLVQAAVYQQLGPARRAELHSRAAELGEDEAVRLHHRARAASGPDLELSADLARLGRDQAVRGVWSSAARHLVAAARLSPVRADAEQLTIEATECQLLSGDVPDPAAKAAEIALFSQTAWRDYLLGRLALGQGRFDDAEALLRDSWRRCDPSGASGDLRLGARVSAWLAALMASKLNGAESATWAGRARLLAPDHTVFDLNRHTELTGLATSGHLDATLASLVDLPDPALASVSDLDALTARGVLYTWSDDLDNAQRDLAGVLSACQGRSVLFRGVAAVMLGLAEFRAGRWDDATLHCDLALSLMADSDQASLAPFCHVLAVFVPAARGQWDAADGHIAMARAFAVSGVPVTTVYAAMASACVARARGRSEEVVAALAPVARPGLLDVTAEPGAMSWQDTLIDAYVDVGDTARAEALLDPFEQAAHHFGRSSAIAAAARNRGHLEARRGNQQRADDAFQVGLKAAARVDLPFERAMLQAAYGSFLRRLGKRAAAGTQLQAAQDTFAKLDARPYLDRCRRELAACGCNSGERPRQRHSSRLTNQELAVGRLVATGLTNRQVARELVVSEKTVEYHLRNAFVKLDVTSRTQLARAFTEQ